MPLTAATVTVLALAIVPGALGTYVWDALVGGDYRRKDWEAAIRFVAFSVLGLGAYVLAAAVFPSLPAAIHIIPSSYTDANFTASNLAPIFLSYFGHLVCSAGVGAIAAFCHRLVSRLTGFSSHASTWDQFIHRSLPGRWVVVTLKSGDVYAGQISTAEESAPAAERDVVLRLPATFDAETKNYIGTPYFDLFLPAELVQSIGTIRKDSELITIPAPGESLFPRSVEAKAIIQSD